MTESRGSGHPKRWDRRSWMVAAVGTVLLAAGGILITRIVADDGSPASQRSTAKRPTTSQTTVPASSALPTSIPSVPRSTAPSNSGPCGQRRAVTAPAPSGGDDTHALNAFFASTPNNSCVAFARGTYRLDGTLRISGKSGLEIRGNQAILAAQTQGDLKRRHVVIAKSSNIAINDLHVRGANQRQLGSQWAFEGQHGFDISERSTDIRLVNVHVDEVYGDAIYIGGGSANVVVQGGVFSYTGRQGIAVTEARGVTLDGFTIRKAGRFCIDLEPNVQRVAVEQVTIRNTTAECPMGWLIVHSATVRRVYSDNNNYNGSPMPEGRLTPGVYPKRSR